MKVGLRKNSLKRDDVLRTFKRISSKIVSKLSPQKKKGVTDAEFQNLLRKHYRKHLRERKRERFYKSRVDRLGYFSIKTNQNLIGRKILFLDLDETLIHSTFEHTDDAHFTVNATYENNKTQKIFIFVRPYVKEFLSVVSKIFEIILFTASVSKYADPIIESIDPNKCFFHHKLYRRNCAFENGYFIKDLSRIENRNISQMIIIDNSDVSFYYQPENSILIKSWFGDTNDKELIKILPWLVKLKDEITVYDTLTEYRVIRRQRIDKILKFNQCEEILESLKGNCI